MKTQVAVIVCAMASLGAAIPCGESSSQITFENIDPGSYRHLVYGIGTDGLLTIAAESGDCLDVRAVDPTIHHEIHGARAVAVDQPVVVVFDGDCWGITVYQGADTVDPDRHPYLRCYGDDELLSGGSYGWIKIGGELGPGSYQRLFYRPASESIDYCILEPEGEGVFMSVLDYKADDQTEQAKVRAGLRDPAKSAR